MLTMVEISAIVSECDVIWGDGEVEDVGEVEELRSCVQRFRGQCGIVVGM